MRFLLDTNILSELRKAALANGNVMTWWEESAESSVVSVLSLGEIRQGIEGVRLRDPRQAEAIERWLDRTRARFSGLILPVTEEITDRWGRLPDSLMLPAVDALLAATALEHGLIVATRNVRDFERCGVPVVNPFEEGMAHG